MTDRQVALERLVTDAPDSPILHVVSAWAAFPRRLWNCHEVSIAVAAPLNLPLKLGEEMVYARPRVETFRALPVLIDDELPAWLYAVDEAGFANSDRQTVAGFVRRRVL